MASARVSTSTARAEVGTTGSRQTTTGGAASGGTAPATPATRDQILDAAIELFAAHGYDGTSLNDIAAEVGIRRPSLLHHFPSKEALYSEVFEQLLSDWLARLGDAVSSPEKGWEKVELVLRAGFDYFADNFAYVRLVRRAALDGGTHLALDLAAVLRPMFDLAVRYFEREMQAGTFRSHDPAQLLITGYGALLSYFSDALFVRGLTDIDPMSPPALELRRDHIIRLFHAALLPTS